MNCPIRSTTEFKELSGILGEDKAVSVWSNNKGNHVDKTPSGADSSLFKKLSTVYGRPQAIKLKSDLYSLDYTSIRGEWFNGESRHTLDSKGEPTIVDAMEYGRKGVFNLESAFTDENDRKLAARLGEWTKTIGIRIEAMDDSIHRFDGNVVAAADMAKKLIVFSKGNASIEDLYEETAHFIIEGLGAENPTISKILDNIENTAMWGEFNQMYKDLYDNDMHKVRMEIAGKLLAETLIHKSAESIQKEIEKDSTMSKRLTENMNGALNQVVARAKNSDPNSVDQMIKDSYGKIVEDVLDGVIEYGDLNGIDVSQEVYFSAKPLNKLPAEAFVGEYIESTKNLRNEIYMSAETIDDKKLAADTRAIQQGVESSLKYKKIQESVSLVLRDQEKETNRKYEILSNYSLESLKAMSDSEISAAAKELNKVGKALDVFTPMINRIKPSLINKTIAVTDSFVELANVVISKESDLKAMYNELAPYVVFREFKDTIMSNKDMTEEKAIKLLRESEDITATSKWLLNMAMMGDDWMRIADSKHKDEMMTAEQFIMDDINLIKNAGAEYGDYNTDFMYDGAYQVSNYDVSKYEKDMDDFVGKLISNNSNYLPGGVVIREGVKDMVFIIAAFKRAIVNNPKRAKAIEESYKNNFLIPMAQWVAKSNKGVKLNRESINGMEAIIYKSKEVPNIHEDKNAKGYVLSDKYKTGKLDGLTAKQRKYYDVVMPLLQKYSDMLGATGLKSLMPQINKDFFEMGKDNGIYEAFVTSSKRSITTTSDDADVTQFSAELNQKGEALKLPRSMFTKRLKDESDMTKDSISAAIKFIYSAGMTKAKTKSLAKFEMLLTLISDRTITTGKDGNEKSAKKGGNTFEALESYIDSEFYGEMVNDPMTFNFGKYGVRVDKVVDLLAAYTAYNMLALNIYAGIANPLLGVSMLHQEAFADEFWDNTELMRATLHYAAHMPGVLKDAGSTISDNKMRLFMDRVDAMQDIGDRASHMRANRSGVTRALNMSNLFLINHAGEHMLHGVAAMAFGERYAKDIGLKDADGNPVSLFDAYEVKDNDVVISKGTVKADGKAFGHADVARFSKKLAHINQSLHGIYNKVDKGKFQKKMIGSLVFMFRKFMVPGLMRNYMSSRFDYIHEDTREGTFITASKFLGGYAADNFVPNTIKEAVGLSDNLAMNWNEMSKNQRANMARFTVWGLQTASLLIAYGFLKEMADDDEDNWLTNMTAFQTRRVYSELQFFNMLQPQEMLRVLKSPAAVTGTIDSSVKALTRLFLAPFGETYSSGNNKGKNKTSVAMENAFIPMSRTIDSWFTPELKIKMFDRIDN